MSKSTTKLWILVFWLGFIAGGIFTYIALTQWMIDLFGEVVK